MRNVKSIMRSGLIFTYRDTRYLSFQIYDITYAIPILINDNDHDKAMIDVISASQAMYQKLNYPYLSVDPFSSDSFYDKYNKVKIDYLEFTIYAEDLEVLKVVVNDNSNSNGYIAEQNIEIIGFCPNNYVDIHYDNKEETLIFRMFHSKKEIERIRKMSRIQKFIENDGSANIYISIAKPWTVPCRDSVNVEQISLSGRQ